VSRLNVRTGRVLDTIAVGDRSASVAVTADAGWVASDRDETVERIDRRTGRIVATIAISPPRVGGARQLAAAPGAVWVTGRDEVLRIDPSNNAVVARVPVAGPSD
jgi:virginiamycin B lyase